MITRKIKTLPPPRLEKAIGWRISWGDGADQCWVRHIRLQNRLGKRNEFAGNGG